MSAPFVTIPVSAEQAGQLEVAWMLIAGNSPRRVAAEDAWKWREAQAHILGFVPEGDWSPAVESVSGERSR